MIKGTLKILQFNYLSFRSNLPMKFAIFKKLVYFLTVSIVLWLNMLKTKTAINTKISMFAICVELNIYLLLYNSHDHTFKKNNE